MASVQDHIQSIENNEEFFRFLQRTGEHPEWAVVVIFYIAVHYGRALLAVKGIQINSHGQFESEFLKAFDDFDCYRHLELMKGDSQAAQYDNRRFTWDEVDAKYKELLGSFKECCRKHARKLRLDLP